MVRKIFMVVIPFMALSIAFTSFAEEESPAQKKDIVAARETAAPSSEKSAASPEAVKPNSAKTSKGVKEMSNEELINEMRSMVSASGQMLAAAANIQAVKDKKGDMSLVYMKADGKSVPIENLDRATLETLYLKMRSERTRLDNERLTRQLRDIRNIQEMNKQQRMLRSIQTPNVKVYKPPVSITTNTVNIPKTPIPTTKNTNRR